MREEDGRQVKGERRKKQEARRRVLRSVFHVFMLILLVSSCGTRKKLVMLSPPADYQWMTGKIKGELEVDGEKLGFSGTIRMRRDSAIWISASAMMGMESLRTLMTQDSVIVVNRMDQTYLAEPLSEVAGKLNLPMTLESSQALLLGNGTSDHVEIHYGPYLAKIRYSDIQWDQPTSFPIKINKKYERMKL